jgi:hypothetical protein
MQTIVAANHIHVSRAQPISHRSHALRKGGLKKILRWPVRYLRNFHGLTTPFFTPAVQPIELYFFQRVFDRLSEQRVTRLHWQNTHGGPASQEDPPTSFTAKTSSNASKDSNASSASSSSSWTSKNGLVESEDKSQGALKEVSLVQFHRAMVRLFRLLRQPYPEDQITKFDTKANGKLGWYELCSFWKLLGGSLGHSPENGIAVRLTVAERIFLTLEDAEHSIMGRVMSIIVFIAILVSTICFILGTVPEFQSQCVLEGEPNFDASCKPETDKFFQDADLGCVIFFTIEYGLRLLLSGIMRVELVDKDRQQLLEWMTTEDIVKEPNFLKRASTWFLHPANLIDLAAIMPWFLSKAFENSGGEDSLIIRLIRLTRVIRAIRLGKKFEAVVIVVRSVRRSLRALYVLILNVVLGVIVFGSLMYFCEQGKWDEDKQTFLRWEGVIWNADSKEWEDDYQRSPFESIPACFWWAIVTATTVGYGDIYPTTAAGKAIAAITMAWSLCVLALPIGVIGSNFSNVWEEYDREKAFERKNAAQEQMMFQRSIAWGDPLHYSRRLLIEVWHDPGLSDPDVSSEPDESMMCQGRCNSDNDQAEFMGEVDCLLEMPPKSSIHHRRCTLPLNANFDKARRRVRGQLTFEYSWRPTPLDKCSPDSLLCGELEITVLEGEDLIAVDWKGSCNSDPYVVVVAYPQSPEPGDARIETSWYRSQTEWNAQDPRWNYKCSFDVHWTQAGTAQCMAADMKQLGNAGGEESPIARAPSRKSQLIRELAVKSQKRDDPQAREQEKVEMTQRLVPELQERVFHLENLVVPQIRGQIQDVQQDLNLIVATLRDRGLTTNGEAKPSEARPQPSQGVSPRTATALRAFQESP